VDTRLKCDNVCILRLQLFIWTVNGSLSIVMETPRSDITNLQRTEVHSMDSQSEERIYDAQLHYYAPTLMLNIEWFYFWVFWN